MRCRHGPNTDATDYGNGEDAKYYDINAMTVEMLVDAGVDDISLVVPLFPAAPAVTKLLCTGPTLDDVPVAVVQMNSFWIDAALELAQTYNHHYSSERPIRKIVLGDGAYPVKKGFDPKYCTDADWLNQRSKCQGVQEYFRFQDYEDLVNYVIHQIQTKKDADGNFVYPDLQANGIELAIAQRLNLKSEHSGKHSETVCQNDLACQAHQWCYRSYASASRPPHAAKEDPSWSEDDYGNFAGVCVPRTGWTECTNTTDPVTKPMSTSCGGASGEMSFLEYYDSQISTLAEGTPVALGAPIFLADLVTFSQLQKETETGTGFTAAQLALEDAIGVAGSQLSDPLEAVVQAGWSSAGESSSQFEDELTYLKEMLSKQSGEEKLSFVLDQFFDQPWKAVPIDFPGMPRSECGRVFAAPPAPSDEPATPPGESFFPAVCAGSAMPWGANVSKCLCLNNLTKYAVQAHSFVSDLDGPETSGLHRLVSPDITTTFPRHRYRSDPDEEVLPKDRTFSEFAVFGDGVRASSYIAGKWTQWPRPLLPYCPAGQSDEQKLCPRCNGCVTWNNLPCSPCGTEKGQFVSPPKSPRDAIPGTRCGMNSDAQTKSLTFNNALQCPRLWYQFYCEGGGGKDMMRDPDNVFCSRPTEKNYNNPPDFDGRQTPLDPWDLECSDDPKIPLYDSVTRIDRDPERRCLTLLWTAKGSAYDWASGWELKTLAPPCAQYARTRVESEQKAFEEWHMQDKDHCAGLLKFAQAPMTVFPEQDLKVDHDRREVSGTFQACDPLLFPRGLATGKQYWWRIQPFAGEQLADHAGRPGGTSGGSGPTESETPLGSILASVDAIDIEYDPICHVKAAGGSARKKGPRWDRVGKFTIGIKVSSHPQVKNPPTRFSKISRAEFILPEAYACKDADESRFPQSCAGAEPGTRRSFFMTPGRDNITSDFSLPGCPKAPCNGSDAHKKKYYTTSMVLHFWDEITQDGAPVYGRDKPCKVDLLISAGKNVGDQGGQAVITHYYPDGAEGDAKKVPATGIPLAHPEWACYLELQGDNKTVNGANFEFCGAQSKNTNLCTTPCDADACCAPSQ